MCPLGKRQSERKLRYRDASAKSGLWHGNVPCQHRGSQVSPPADPGTKMGRCDMYGKCHALLARGDFDAENISAIHPCTAVLARSSFKIMFCFRFSGGSAFQGTHYNPARP